MINAVTNGINVIVCTDEVFEYAIYEMQQMENAVRFILLNGTSSEEDGLEKVRGNTSSVLLYKEQIFWPVMRPVKEEYVILVFLGSMNSEENVRYGSGYLQNIDQATEEMEIFQ